MISIKRFIYEILIMLILLTSLSGSSREWNAENIHRILSKYYCGNVTLTTDIYNQWRSLENVVLYALISGDESCAIRLSEYLSNKEIYSIDNENGILISAILYGKIKLVSYLLSRDLNFKACSNQLAASAGMTKNIKLFKKIASKFNLPCHNNDGKDYTFYSAVYSLNYVVIKYYHNNKWLKYLTKGEKNNANDFLKNQTDMLNDIAKNINNKDKGKGSSHLFHN